MKEDKDIIKKKGLSNPPQVGKIMLFGKFEITTIAFDDLNYWVKLEDLSEALGFSNTGHCSKWIKKDDKMPLSKLISDGPKIMYKKEGSIALRDQTHPKEEDSIALRDQTHPFYNKKKKASWLSKYGSSGNAYFISEKGLYEAIGKSKTPEAAEVQDWVYGILLPHVLKTGSYIHGKEEFKAIDTETNKEVYKAPLSDEGRRMVDSLIEGDNPIATFLPNMDPFLD